MFICMSYIFIYIYLCILFSIKIYMHFLCPRGGGIKYSILCMISIPGFYTDYTAKLLVSGQLFVIHIKDWSIAFKMRPKSSFDWVKDL